MMEYRTEQVTEHGGDSGAGQPGSEGALPMTGCVNLANVPDLTVPRFPRLQNENNDSLSSQLDVRIFKELIYTRA